jgi:hypothetical protein
MPSLMRNPIWQFHPRRFAAALALVAYCLATIGLPFAGASTEAPSEKLLAGKKSLWSAAAPVSQRCCCCGSPGSEPMACCKARQHTASCCGDKQPPPTRAFPGVTTAPCACQANGVWIAAAETVLPPPAITWSPFLPAAGRLCVSGIFPQFMLLAPPKPPPRSLSV